MACAPVAAQTVDGLDVGAARARARAREDEARQFSATINRRSQTMRADAEGTARGAAANRARLGVVAVPGGPSTTGVDFDKLIASANQADRTKLSSNPKFIAFASTSMPPASLRSMLFDVTRAGGVVVFQGFRDNSVKSHMAYLQQVVARGDKVDGLGIDPRLFRAFAVNTVPTYVVVSTDFETCDGFRCQTQLPPHDRLSGNVSAAYALQTFVSGKGPGAAIAKVALARLGKAGAR